MKQYIGAIDQGTTVRDYCFDRAGEIIACAQEEYEQIYPELAVEDDVEEIWLAPGAFGAAMDAGRLCI
jgi:glycerol kinase